MKDIFIICYCFCIYNCVNIKYCSSDKILIETTEYKSSFDLYSVMAMPVSTSDDVLSLSELINKKSIYQ